MKTKDAVAAFDDPRYLADANHIRVVTKTGCEYGISLDVIEVATDDFFQDDGVVYGHRLNGTPGGPFRRGTQGQLRWIWLRNLSLKESES